MNGGKQGQGPTPQHRSICYEESLHKISEALGLRQSQDIVQTSDVVWSAVAAQCVSSTELACPVTPEESAG